MKACSSPLRAAVHKAKKEGAPVREEGVRVKSNGGHHEINMEVIPVKGDLPEAKLPGAVRRSRRRAIGRGIKPPRKGPAADAIATTLDKESAEQQVRRLTQELVAAREYLQSVIEQQEATNEELQSANEEAQSANEELQSINEELETSKEEIQSSNEELATVNDELQNRNLELSRVNNDLVNLLGSVQMPIVMLGPDLRIRRFTPAGGEDAEPDPRRRGPADQRHQAQPDGPRLGGHPGGGDRHAQPPRKARSRTNRGAGIPCASGLTRPWTTRSTARC